LLLGPHADAAPGVGQIGRGALVVGQPRPDDGGHGGGHALVVGDEFGRWEAVLAGPLIPVAKAEGLVLLNPEYDANTYSVANGEIMADYAVNRGSLTRDQADAWAHDLRQLGRDRRYFFSLNRYLFLARR
jgi:hypothetical protein